jgi:Lrp/AsnC family transcriptional regulator, leucine-responsive regulatory protein
MEILQILQEKARIPNVEVSRQVGLAPSAVLERIRKMEKQGIIDGYEVRLNPEMFGGGQISYIHIEAEPKSYSEHRLGKQLSNIPEIQEVHHIAGKDGYLIKVRTANTRQLGQLLKEQILVLDGIKSTNTTTVLETYKETSKIPLQKGKGE